MFCPGIHHPMLKYNALVCQRCWQWLYFLYHKYCHIKTHTALSWTWCTQTYHYSCGLITTLEVYAVCLCWSHLSSYNFHNTLYGTTYLHPSQNATRTNVPLHWYLDVTSTRLSVNTDYINIIVLTIW